MTTLNLQSAKVTKGIVSTINNYVYANRADLSNEMKMFYTDVRGIIELQLTKPAKHRLSMSEVLERAYNIDVYILNSGAVSFYVQFISCAGL